MHAPSQRTQPEAQSENGMVNMRFCEAYLPQASAHAPHVQAGTPYAITIATNMAGRGTDIILGGDAKQKVLADFQAQWLPYLMPSAPGQSPAGVNALAPHSAVT